MLNGNYVILSIDFDYFVNADYETRSTSFPDGHEGFSPQIQKIIWDRYYPDMFNIDIKTDELRKTVDYCKGTYAFKKGLVFSFESHKELYDLIKKNKMEKCHVFNIDFHHDMYSVPHRSECSVDCGNWGSVLKEENPDFKLSWIACDDSDRSALGVEEVDCHEIIDLDTLLENTPAECIDVIFICRSDMWTPPHLDKWYKEMELELRKQQILEEREVTVNE